MRKFRRSEVRGQRSDNPIPAPVLRSPTSDLRSPASGVTLLELLAVLTVISISLMIVVGAYGSWGTAHALSGATRILEAGLQQARALAVSQNAYVGFDYGSRSTNGIQTVTGFQIFLYTNENAEVAAELENWNNPDVALDLPHTVPAAPFQRLSGHIRLGYILEKEMTGGTPSIKDGITLLFRPDGSVWSFDDERAHYLCVYTQERVAMGATQLDNATHSKPLTRLLRIDLATGLVLVTVIKEEARP